MGDTFFFFFDADQNTEKRAKFEALRIRMAVGQSRPTGKVIGTNRQGLPRYETKYHERYETGAGMLEPEEWGRRARALIEQYGEQDLFRRLLAVPWVNGGWLRTSGERERYCLEWHMSRIFENPKWVGYREFHAKD